MRVNYELFYEVKWNHRESEYIWLLANCGLHLEMSVNLVKELKEWSKREKEYFRERERKLGLL